MTISFDFVSESLGLLTPATLDRLQADTLAVQNMEVFSLKTTVKGALPRGKRGLSPVSHDMRAAAKAHREEEKARPNGEIKQSFHQGLPPYGAPIAAAPFRPRGLPRPGFSDHAITCNERMTAAWELGSSQR
jgi:hypothetical protein